MPLRKISLLFVCFLVGTSLLFGQAERFTEEEIQLQEKFIAAYSERMLGKVDKAITLLKEVYQADRQNAAVAFELARAYAQKEDNESTKKYIELACKNDRENIHYQSYRADYYKKTDDVNGMISSYEKLIALDPFDEINYYNVGDMYEQTSNTEKALETYYKLENVIGVNEETSRRKFEVYNRIGDQKKAIAELVTLSDTYPSRTRYLNNLASYYKEIGKEKLAEKAYKKVLTIDPDNADATIALAGDITKPGNEAAYFLALQGIIGSPDIDIDTKVKELIPYVQNMSSDPQDPENISLINSIEDLQNAHPGEAKAYAIYGDVLMNVGKVEKATEKYAKTIELNKSNYAVWEQYMYALESQSRYDELITVSNESLDLYPNQAMCYYFNGVAHYKTGDKKEGDSMFEEALLIGRKNEALKKRIEYIQKGTTKVSKKDFREWTFMRGLNPPYSSEVYEQFGDELLKNGDEEGAKEFWGKAMNGVIDKARLEEKISSIKIK